MHPILRVAAFAVGLALPLAASGTASAQRVNYGSQTSTDVTVNYFDMPAGTALSFVSWVSGAKFVPLMPAVSGTGSVALPFTPLPAGPGEYYVLAEAGGLWRGQTVVFVLFKP
jgi:hypothetical protein